MRSPDLRSLPSLRLHGGSQLLRLAEEAAAPSVLRSLALVMRHRLRLLWPMVAASG